jgi:hypothetical protein
MAQLSLSRLSALHCARSMPCGQLEEGMTRQQRGKHGKRQNQALLGRLLQ